MKITELWKNGAAMEKAGQLTGIKANINGDNAFWHKSP